MFKITALLLPIFVLVLVSFRMIDQDVSMGEIEVDSLTLEEVLVSLGETKSEHALSGYDPKKAELGRQLIYTGQAKRGLFKSKPISPYFVCTDCHSMTKELADPSKPSPENRLEYAISQDQSFLPASTFWGMYNRTSWYNGDYVKKYGSLIDEARNDLGEAIQVCAKYCSAGRNLKAWEEEAILHFFKSKELKIKDLPISENDKKNIRKYNQLTEVEKTELRTRISNSFVRAEPATFLETKPRDERKYGVERNADNGKIIYDKACLSCHRDGRVTYLKLSHDVLSARMFVRHLTDYSDLNLYQIVRHGTYSRPGRNQYMPLYTQEKMSDAQLEDLIAYIQQLAKK